MVCGDTIGQDRELPEEQREQLMELVKHFRDSWQKQEHQLLYQDVDYQVRILKGNDKKVNEVIESLDKLN